MDIVLYNGTAKTTFFPIIYDGSNASIFAIGNGGDNKRIHRPIRYSSMLMTGDAEGVKIPKPLHLFVEAPYDYRRLTPPPPPSYIPPSPYNNPTASVDRAYYDALMYLDILNFDPNVQ